MEASIKPGYLVDVRIGLVTEIPDTSSDLRALVEVVGQFAITRDFRKFLVVAIEIVLVVNDSSVAGTVKAAIGGIPPLLETTQEAVLRAEQLLILVEKAQHIVPWPRGIRHQSCFFDEGFVAISAVSFGQGRG